MVLECDVESLESRSRLIVQITDHLFGAEFFRHHLITGSPPVNHISCQFFRLGSLRHQGRQFSLLHAGYFFGPLEALHLIRLTEQRDVDSASGYDRQAEAENENILIDA